MANREELALHRLSKSTDEGDTQSQLQGIHNHDDISKLEQELADGMAKLKINELDKLPEQIKLTEQHIEEHRKDEEILKLLKDLTVLDKEITVMKSAAFLDASFSRMKLETHEQELLNGLAKLQVQDVNQLPEKIQKIEQRIKQSPPYKQILEQLKDLKLLYDKITASKSNRSVIDTSQRKVTDKCISSVAPSTFAKRHLTDNSLEVEPNNETTRSRDNKRFRSNHVRESSAKRPYEASQRFSAPKFFVSLPEVRGDLDKALIDRIRQKYRRLCGWTHQGFPGRHPTRMHRENYKITLQSSYLVSWIPTGKRYMMLIEDRNEVYMLDQGDFLFTVDGIQFPSDEKYTDHLKDTLVDGELVIDKTNASNKIRFLINDIIVYQNTNVMENPFLKRLELIDQLIVNVRDEAIKNGCIKETTQSFTIQAKQFFPLAKIKDILSPTIRENLPYEVEGLIFVREQDPYIPGQCRQLLKWKEIETVDFLLKISTNASKGESAKKEAGLFLNREDTCFATMCYSPELEKYNNKVISCIYKGDQWDFYCLREDRPLPNSRKTFENIKDAVQRPVTEEDFSDLIYSYKCDRLVC